MRGELSAVGLGSWVFGHRSLASAAGSKSPVRHMALTVVRLTIVVGDLTAVQTTLKCEAGYR